jgi:hypothetical protein
MVGNPVTAPAPAAPPKRAPPALSSARRDGPFFAIGLRVDLVVTSLTLVMTYLPVRNGMIARYEMQMDRQRSFLISRLRSRPSQRKKIGNFNSPHKVC